jgi:beta-fructofuranosidase
MELRPSYHFLPEKNWMNDPNGPIQVNGEYHLFYQYNPNGDEWGSIHWGHAKSKDLIHWEPMPIALYPSPERREDHCFSGCTVIQDGRPVFLYTSIGPDRTPTSGAEQWIAYGDENWVQWHKPDVNPILTEDIHGDLLIEEWRDPYVWQMNESWYMVTGGTHKGKGCVTIYRSVDLIKWEFLNVLATGEGRVLECPNLFMLDGKWILTYSPDDKDNRIRYLIGTLRDDFTFSAETQGILDYGGREGYYAPTSFEDEQGRRIVWGWMPENARGTSKAIQGWAGVQAVPRTLHIDPVTGELMIRPVKELEGLRGEHFEFSSDELAQAEVWFPMEGKALELALSVVVPNEQGKWGIRFFRSPDGEEESLLEFDHHSKLMRLIRTKMNSDSDMHHFPLEAPIPRSLDGKFEIRLFLDHSTVEVFVNERVALSGRVYPMREDSTLIGINVENGSISFPELHVYKLNLLAE